MRSLGPEMKLSLRSKAASVSDTSRFKICRRVFGRSNKRKPVLLPDVHNALQYIFGSNYPQVLRGRNTPTMWSEKAQSPSPHLIKCKLKQSKEIEVPAMHQIWGKHLILHMAINWSWKVNGLCKNHCPNLADFFKLHFTVGRSNKLNLWRR